MQGNVVLMRSRYEDAKAARTLLLQPIEPIDSHFRSGSVATVGEWQRYPQIERPDVTFGFKGLPQLGSTGKKISFQNCEI